MKKLLAAIVALSVSGAAWAGPPTAANGAVIYKKECASCHGADGKGSKEPAVPAIAGKSASAVAKVMTAGHPSKDKKIELTPDDTAGVARFVSSMKK